MSVPSRAEAAAIVQQLAPPDGLRRHSVVVAEIAAFLASAMAERGVEVDGTLIETAALLHDVDKMLPADDPLKQLGHGAAGAEWLRRRGHAELAAAVSHHPVMSLGRAPDYAEWAAEAGLEGRVVAYSDKRARQQQIALDERFADWYGRHGISPPLELAHRRARRLEEEICGLAGVAPEQVGQMAWATEALRGAA